jgi:sugar phosphate isomerase/epimerase
VTIGLSLPLDYIAGTPLRTGSHLLAAALGDSHHALKLLKRHGVRSVELQRIDADAEPIRVLDAFKRILDTGLHLSLHGALVRGAADRSLDRLYPQLIPALGYLKTQERETVMVVHAHAGGEGSTLSLLEATVDSISHLDRELTKYNIPLKVGLEVNRYHGRADPGTTYEGLLEMAHRVNSSALGFCWDMGHTHSSVLQQQLPAVPPPTFLANVIHTHLHGVAPDGDTHWSLVGSYAHIQDGIRQLRKCGYKGIYNLELYPERWGHAIPVRDGILDSIDLLRELLKA